MEHLIRRLIIIALALWPAVTLAGPGITYIENKGQWPCDFDFVARNNGSLFGLDAGSFTVVFFDQQHQHHGDLPRADQLSARNAPLRGHVLKTNFLNANQFSTSTPFGLHTERYNYFVGKQEEWHTSVSGYDGVMYPSLYSGIDLKVYSSGNYIKYDFMVAAGADISKIQWSYDGATQLSLKDGNITIGTTLAAVIEQKPIAYQWVNGEKKFVEAEYTLTNGVVKFKIGAYDNCLPLVIDPILIFSTYSGSTADNWGSTATPGERGTLYSSGITNLYLGGSFPATTGAFQTKYGGNYDVALLKYDSIGHKLLFASYLGGFYSETPHSLVMDKDQNLLVLGTTSSSNFPVTSSAVQKNFKGGYALGYGYPEQPIPYEVGSDIFVAKISRDGSQLLASTYLGGSSNDGLNPTYSPLVKNYGDQMRGDIISDAAGNVIISSVTSSTDFPVMNSFGLTYHGGMTDAVLTKLSPDFSSILWSTYLGGSGADASHTIQVDNQGNFIVGGGTTSNDFPTTVGSYQPNLAGDADGWMAKIKPDGSSITRCTLTGTSLFNEVFFLDVDQAGEVYVYGQTVGSFPVTTGVYQNANSGQFIQKFDSTLSSLRFSTVFGSGIGIPNISPTAFLVNDCNNLYIAGWGGITNSLLGYWNSDTQNMPVTSNAFQRTTSGSDFYFMALSSDGKQLLYATYLGGVDSRTHIDGGTCRFDKSGVVYHAVCSGCQGGNATGHETSDFPTTPGAWSRVNGSLNCNNAAFKFDLASLRAIIQTNNTSFSAPGINQICKNESLVFQNLSIGGQVFQWSFSNGLTINKFDTSYVRQQFPKAGTYRIKLKITDKGTCAVTDSTFVDIVVVDPLGKAGPDASICTGSSTTLQASGGINYSWTSSDRTFTSLIASPSVSPTANTSYFVTIEDVNHCKVQDTVKITIVPVIDLKLKTSILFGCTGRPPVKVTNLTDASENVTIDFGDGSTSDQQQLQHDYAKDGNYTIKLIGQKDFCVYETQSVVPINTRIVPNVFTPDESPGANDTYLIQYGAGLPVAGAPLDVQVSVRFYNRWGKLVFQDADYRNTWTASNVESGIYYAEVKLGDEVTCKTWVHIIK